LIECTGTQDVGNNILFAKRVSSQAARSEWIYSFIPQTTPVRYTTATESTPFIMKKTAMQSDSPQSPVDTESTSRPGSPRKKTERLPQQAAAPVSQAPERARLNLREEQKLFTRDRLLTAALEVFRQVGYRAATIDQITALIGANRATFYLHFKDKLDVATGLARGISKLSAQRFMHLDSGETQSLASVRKWLDEYLDENGRDPVLGQILTEVLASDPEFAREYLEYCGRIADKMLQHLGRWTGKRREIARSKLVLVEMMLGRYLTMISSQGLEFPGKFERDALAEAIWAVLFSDSAAQQSSKKKPAKRAGDGEQSPPASRGR